MRDPYALPVGPPQSFWSRPTRGQLAALGVVLVAGIAALVVGRYVEAAPDRKEAAERAFIAEGVGACQDAVRGYYVRPDAVQFPAQLLEVDQWFGRDVHVQGTAYAENSYGVSEESHYLCTAVNEGGGWTTRDIIVTNW